MANKMWGGRFSTSPADVMEKINASVDFDQRLYEQDIAASIAHCKMLGETGILTTPEVTDICNGLLRVKEEIDSGTFKFSRALEDIHMNVESRLRDLIGPVAGKLHTARSRNDQVATDFRLHLRDWADRLDRDLKALQVALASKAVDYAGLVMPGFTHLQMAQPVTFGHHLLAYVEMIARDRGRLVDARARMNESPLGAAALAGTSFPIDRGWTATSLAFDRPMRNSLDAVSDRDFVLELLAACVIGSVHLSRLAEEIVLWCTAQFRFITLSDRYTTGSSIMPQKRNPDAAELTRAKVGRILGAFTAVSVVMKGLPLAYSKDMQEDKEATFDALESYAVAIAAMTGMIDDMTANEGAMRDAASLGFATATDLADWLVRRLGMPFRDAHHVTGSIVRLAEAAGVDLASLPLSQMQAVEPRITGEVYEVLTVDASVRSRTSLGGTAPDLVRAEAMRWLDALG